MVLFSAIRFSETLCEIWNEPDDGIWEVRSGRAHHTHSKVLALIGLDRLIRMCHHYKWKAPLDKYQKVIAQIRTAVETHGFNQELGAYTKVFSGHELDASLLAMPLLGYCSASSVRMVSTRKAILRTLSENGLIYRYRDGDGLSGQEGAFGICSFWMVEAMAKAGEWNQAEQWFESLLARSNQVGLWPEEIGAQTNQFLGNYPQAFTHIGLINAALTLSHTQQGQFQ